MYFVILFCKSSTVYKRNVLVQRVNTFEEYRVRNISPSREFYNSSLINIPKGLNPSNSYLTISWHIDISFFAFLLSNGVTKSSKDYQRILSSTSLLCHSEEKFKPRQEYQMYVHTYMIEYTIFILITSTFSSSSVISAITDCKSC